ncbi:MAG: hypothetical protein GY884_08055 [Proteobacteria bacterium]|nr:hypothetical protein [Pseudomonadota bacterium]
MLAAWLSGTWLGCTEPVENEEEVPSTFSYDAPEEEGPALTVDELEDRVEQILGKVYSYDAQPMIDIYWDLIEDTDESCPAWYATDDSDYWIAADDGAAGQDTEGEQGGCVTTGATEYRGWAYTQRQDAYITEDGWTIDKDYVSALAWIWTPSGDLYEAAGTLLTSVQTLDLEQGDFVLAESRIEGVFGWDGSGLEDTWIGVGEVPDMAIETQSMLQRHFVEVEGGVSGVQDLDGLDAFAFNDFIYGDEFYCALEPSGVISLRQPDGQWYEVQFDGPDEEQDTQVNTDPACDGCGRVYFRSQEWGTICVDFGTLLDWDISPWS